MTHKYYSKLYHLALAYLHLFVQLESTIKIVAIKLDIRTRQCKLVLVNNALKKQLFL